jgi:hypothetical protein
LIVGRVLLTIKDGTEMSLIAAPGDEMIGCIE